MVLKNFTAISFVGSGLFVAISAITPLAAPAQTVTMNGAMLERCESEGLTGEICACWFSEIAAAEGLTEFSEGDIDALASAYQDELAACVDANSDYDEDDYDEDDYDEDDYDEDDYDEDDY